MKKKLLILAGVGFLAGMAIGNLIPLLFCLLSEKPISLYSSAVLSFTGSPAAAIVVNTLISGLYGMICMGGVVVYDIEHWPLIRASLIHYLSCMLPYIPIALLLGWNNGISEMLVETGIMTAVYFLIWLIIYLNYRKQVRELNEINRQRDAAETPADPKKPE